MDQPCLTHHVSLSQISFLLQRGDRNVEGVHNHLVEVVLRIVGQATFDVQVDATIPAVDDLSPVQKRTKWKISIVTRPSES